MNEFGLIGSYANVGALVNSVVAATANLVERMTMKRPSNLIMIKTIRLDSYGLNDLSHLVRWGGRGNEDG